MLLRCRHSGLDGVGEALKASIAPEPGTERKISANRRANATCAMTPGARRPGNLAVKDLLAKRDLVTRCSWWYWQTRIGMNAFRRQSFWRSRGFHRGSGRRLNSCIIRIAEVGHAPDPTSLVIGDVKRAVRSDCQA